MAKSKGRRQQPRRRKGPTPAKRRVESGRVTASKQGRSAPARSEPGAVAPSVRYTPPVKNRGLFRPLWHKIVGGVLVLLGLGIFVANDLEWLGVHLMPGGHNELYAMGGILVAASSIWWFGWMDRSPTRW